jgi:hypothetical protein
MASKIPQDAAADLIVARAKADAKHAAAKKKRKKVLKKSAVSVAVAAAAEKAAPDAASEGAVAEDPYVAAVDDPYA